MIGDQRFSVSGSTVRECREKERIKSAKVAAGQYTRNDRITVRQYFEEWMDRKKGTVRESTIRAQKTAFAPVLSVIGGVKVVNLERRQVIALQKELSETLTTAGVNYRITILQSLLKSARLDKIRPDSPADGVKPLQRTEPEARDNIHRALTPEEQTAFFRAAAGEIEAEGRQRQAGKTWYYELLCFLIQTGVRVGEATALKWSDIDQKAGVIHIRRTVTETAAGPVLGKSTKTRAGIRDIPLTDGIKETLRQQRQKCLDFLGAVPLDGLVFVSQKEGGIIRRSSVGATVTRICDLAEIDHVGVHSLRHTFATRCIEQGMTMQTLKTIMGHNSLSMTADLYGHVLPETKQAEMNKISIAF